MKLKTTVIMILLIFGITSLILSIVYENSTVAFIGLGLTLWGLLISYISNEKYIKKEILDTTSLPLLMDLNIILHEFGYDGNIIYLPPKLLQDFESNKIFITKNQDINFDYEDVSKRINQKSIFSKNPEGLLIDPPGSQLLKLFESQSGTRFTSININQLQEHLQKTLVDLQMARNIEIESNNEDRVKVTLSNAIFDEMIQDNEESTTGNSLETPLHSAIACALTKVTGKPLIINRVKKLDENRNEITFRFLEPIQKAKNLITISKKPEKQYSATSSLKRQNFLPQKWLNKIELLMITVGSILLIFSGFITVYDTIIWNKDIITILFGSRIGENISLGIGFKLFYYMAIGLAFFITSLIILKRKGDQKK